MDDLRESVYLAHGRELLTRYAGPALTGPAADPDDREPLLDALRPHLGGWAARWHLTDPPGPPPPGAGGSLLGWLGERVLDTFVDWHGGRNLNPPGWTLPNGPTLASSLEAPTPLAVRIGGWALLGETEDAFQRRTVEQFTRYVDDYIARCRGAVPGWPP